MKPEDAKDREIAALKEELESMRQLTARTERVTQNLRDTQFQLDMLLDKFDRMHEYARRAFETHDSAFLYGIIAEGIVDVLGLEFGAVFEVDLVDRRLLPLSVENLDLDAREFPLPAGGWGPEDVVGRFSVKLAVCESPVANRPWTDMGLSSVVFMPFYDNEGQMASLMVGGVTEEGKQVYDFIPEQLLSPFMVYCRQMNGILGLIDAVDKANQAGRAKSRFLANLSHEIRTPMNAIIGMAQIAQRSGDEQEIGRCIRQIGLSSKHLLGLINDVLDISKIEDGKFRLSQNAFDLREVVETVRVGIAQLTRTKKQDLDIVFHDVGSVRLVGDDIRLSQVLINLLGNAQKFTPEGGRITLDVSEFARDDESVTLRFEVSDTGIGIDSDFLSRIFQPFEQADNGISRHYGGTGLGLAISRYIVELMGGHIRVDSVPGQGTCFSFSVRFDLDQKSEPTKDEAVLPEVLPDFSEHRILVVDDVRINRVIIASFLRDTKIEVEEAENGEEALDKFLQSPPGHYSLIFMDMQMPLMDGCTATRKIRASDHVDALTIPIIAMTANVFKEDVQEVLDAGMNGHIGKPVDMKIVVDTTRKSIR